MKIVKLLLEQEVIPYMRKLFCLIFMYSLDVFTLKFFFITHAHFHNIYVKLKHWLQLCINIKVSFAYRNANNPYTNLFILFYLLVVYIEPWAAYLISCLIILARYDLTLKIWSHILRWINNEYRVLMLLTVPLHLVKYIHRPFIQHVIKKTLIHK